MGIFDLFGGKGSTLKKHAARVADKRAQAPDRWESIQALSAMKSAEAVEALVVRFSYTCDPTITDAEEKDAAFDAIVNVGEAARAPAKMFLRRSDTIAWPLRILTELLPDDEVTSELLDVLGTMGTEYERDPERKLQLLTALEERRDTRIAKSAARFLDDVNDTARFSAVGAIFAQDNADEVRKELIAALCQEESNRVQMRILDGFSARNWDLGEARTSLKVLPTGYTVDSKGIPRGPKKTA